MSAYDEIWSSPIVAYRDEIVAAVNSPEVAPEYLVWGIIEERDTRVLVLKRRNPGKSDGGLEPFPRTWGLPAEELIGRDFRGALAAVDKLRSPILDADPVLLFSYKNFNVIRYGKVYVGVARELGKLDVEAVMANLSPFPPAGQFIVTPDLTSLEEAIDASILTCPPSYAKKPVLLFTYKTYNVVHAQDRYVGIANDVGAIDVDVVLSNMAPRPPAEKFIVADSIARLESAIDDTHPVTNPIVLYFNRVIQKSTKWIRRIRG